MRRYTMRYPGDPAMQVMEMSRQEFLEAFPRTPTQLIDLGTGEVLERIEYGPDEIICDLCDGDPGDTVFLVGPKGICRSCFEKRLKRYCT